MLPPLHGTPRNLLLQKEDWTATVDQGQTLGFTVVQGETLTFTMEMTVTVIQLLLSNEGTEYA